MDFLSEFGQSFLYIIRNLHPFRRFPEFFDFIHWHLWRGNLISIQDCTEVFRHFDIFDFLSDQKPVVDGSPSRVFRDFIGAGNGKNKRHLYGLAAVGELSVSQSPEKHVDDARIGLPDLVQVSHLGFWQLTLGNEHVLVFFERLDALDAEDVFVFSFVREKKSESFKLQGIAEHLGQMALRGSRRTEEEDMGFCRQAQEDCPDGMVQFDEVGMKIVLEFFESLHVCFSFGFFTSR